jgi:hypothetical protein
LAPDPASLFGPLYNACIRDQYVGEEGLLKETVVATAVGMACSVLTAYGLSLLGILV